MDKALRCTVCVWRGAWCDTAHGGAVAVSKLPAWLLDIQAVYEQKQAESARFGMTREPPCPKCGHHTAVVRDSPSFHPTM